MRKLCYILLLLIAVQAWLPTPLAAHALLNSYPFGTPAYWYTASVNDVTAGKYTLACLDLEHAAEAAAKISDKQMQATMLMALGELKGKLGEWEEAMHSYAEALQIAADANSDDKQALVLADMMATCRTIGDIEGYNKYTTQMDSIYKCTTSASAKLAYHLYWAYDFMTRGEFYMTELHLQGTQELFPQLAPTEREGAKQYYFHQAQKLETARKNFPKAIEYAKEYVKQTGKMYGKYSDKYYQAHGDLVSLYTFAGDSAKAFSYLRTVERGIGHYFQNEEITATFYNTVGLCYGNFKQYEEAIEWFDKAYNVMARKKPEFSPAKLASLQYKTEAYIRLNEFEECLKPFNELTKACEFKFGKMSPQYQQTMGILALIEGKRGNISRADSLFRGALTVSLDRMRHIWQYSTPTLRQELLTQTFGSVGEIAQFAIEYGIKSGELAKDCYDALLFSKALLLESERSLAQAIRSEGTKEDIDNYNSLLAINNRLTMLNTNFEVNKHEIDSLVNQQRELERKLARTNSNYKEYEKYVNLNYEDVRGMLRENETVVDFTSYMRADSIREYTAFIFSKDSEFPALRRCFDQQQLDSLLDGAPPYTLYDHKQLANKATQLLWGPLMNDIDKKHTIYYIPTGVIHGIVPEALPLADGTPMGQDYDFIRLTSAREIASLRDNAISKKDAVIYGGLIYSLSQKVMEKESKVYDTKELAWIKRSGYGNKGFKDLTKTKEEADEIEKILRDNGFAVTPLTGTKGNAESFLSLSGKAPAILHIATHGFYYTPEETTGNKFLSGYTDAMSLSGLVFAGGNTAWLGKEMTEGVLGGILTAKDIANMDLRGTHLAVLSACETAQGMVNTDGVWGLQRAFKKAGAGTIVMVLWSISDIVAKDFMVAFYQQLVNAEHKGNRRRAFERAREIIRQKYPDPYHWASFVMLD